MQFDKPNGSTTNIEVGQKRNKTYIHLMQMDERDVMSAAATVSLSFVSYAEAF